MKVGPRMSPDPCVPHNEVHYSRAGLGFIESTGQCRCKHSMKYLNKVRGRSGEFEFVFFVSYSNSVQASSLSSPPAGICRHASPPFIEVQVSVSQTKPQRGRFKLGLCYVDLCIDEMS